MKHKTSDLTPWFPKGVKPVRKGVYIASMAGNNFYRYWNGKWWSNGVFDLEKNGWPDVRNGKFGSYKEQMQMRFRGLAKDPSLALPVPHKVTA